MNDWQQLVTPSAPLDTGFPDCAITDLSHLGLIRVEGDDMRSFLQGQLTNDVNAVTGARGQLSSYCSPKGRMLGSFRVFQRGDALYLEAPVERLEPIRKRLAMFVLRSQVGLSDASGELARFGITGDCAGRLLPCVPDGEDDTITRDDITVLRMPGETARYQVIGPADQLIPLWQTASVEARQTGADFWALMDIRAGVPTVLEDTVEAFVPQMANLQLINGVSFTKGCYTGQEVVARMQYLGKLKRRMYRARITTDKAPRPGMELFSPSSESGQGTGRIVDAAPSPDGGYEVLAVMQISSADAADVRLGDADGPALELLSLPYDFEPAEG